MPKKLLQITALIFAVFLLGLSVLLFVPAPVLSLWFVRIFVTEWSWMLCIAAICIARFSRGRSWACRIARLLALLAALAYLVPVVQMVRVAIAQKNPLPISLLFSPPTRLERVPVGEYGQHFYFYPSLRGGNSPCVIVIHGGGWRGGDTSELSKWNSMLAQRGYAVAAISYRLAPQHSWPAAYDDIITALKFLRANAERFKIDPDNLVLMGRSAGGQLAADIAVRKAVPGLRGCICFYAPLDMKFAYRYGEENDILHSPQLLREYLGGTPDAQPQSYRDASPIFFVTPDTVPFLLLHGAKDELVWVRQSQRFAQRLRENGVKHRYIEFPWATHAFDFPPLSFGAGISTAAVLEFLEEVCGSGEQKRGSQ